MDDANAIYQVKVEVNKTVINAICRSFGDANKWNLIATLQYTKTTD